MGLARTATIREKRTVSGIFGLFHRDGRPADRATLETMRDAMAYWGPDGSAVWRDGPAGLGQLLRDPRLERRFILVMTHYAPRLPNGDNDSRLHGLINADDLLQLCGRITHGAILCGHVHHTYRVKVPGLECPIYCAGSATMSGHEGLWVYQFEERNMTATRATWNDEGGVYVLESAACSESRQLP